MRDIISIVLNKIVVGMFTYLGVGILLTISTPTPEHILDEIYTMNIQIAEIYSTHKVGNKTVNLVKTKEDNMVYVYLNNEGRNLHVGEVVEGKLINLSEKNDSIYYVLWYEMYKSGTNKK